MKVSTISTAGKGTGTNTTDPNNTSKATKVNNGGRVEDTTAIAGNGGTAGRAGRGGTERANIPPFHARTNPYDNKHLQLIEPPLYLNRSTARGRACTAKPMYPLFANNGRMKGISVHTN